MLVNLKCWCDITHPACYAMTAAGLADYYFLMDRLRFIAVWCAVVFSVSVGTRLFLWRHQPTDWHGFFCVSLPAAFLVVRGLGALLQMRYLRPSLAPLVAIVGTKVPIFGLSKILIEFLAVTHLNFAPGTDCGRRRRDWRIGTCISCYFSPAAAFRCRRQCGRCCHPTSLRARFPVQQTCRRAKFSDWFCLFLCLFPG